MECAFVLLGLLRYLPTFCALLPLPLLFVYSVTAYAHALRMPRICGSVRVLALLLLLGVVPVVAYHVLESTLAPVSEGIASSVAAAASAAITLPPPSSYPVQSASAACAAVRAAALPLAALVNCDRSLTAKLKNDTMLNGSFGSLMHDSGAGKRSYSPYYNDFFEWTDISNAFFGGAAGGSSITPARGTMACIGLDHSSPPRPYVYLVYDSAYAPSAVARLYASEPERLLDNHVCTRTLCQQRSDGASIPLDVIAGHYWTDAVILPARGDPVLLSTLHFCLPSLLAWPRLGGCSAYCHLRWRLPRRLACSKEGEPRPSHRCSYWWLSAFKEGEATWPPTPPLAC
jgi:hypothetical protein